MCQSLGRRLGTIVGELYRLTPGEGSLCCGKRTDVACGERLWRGRQRDPGMESKTQAPRHALGPRRKIGEHRTGARATGGGGREERDPAIPHLPAHDVVALACHVEDRALSVVEPQRLVHGIELITATTHESDD